MPTNTAAIVFDRVSRTFGEVRAVDEMDLAVTEGSFFTFLGPSGCGKTTSLRLIAGFEQPDRGEVRIAGRNMVGTPAWQRPVNMVFQAYALFPHLSVFDNVAYGLRQRRPRPDRRAVALEVGRMLELVRLPQLAGRRPHELSGGQQQRVALARALINRPTVLLLDEPLAALDRKLRREMQIELQNLQREVGITFVLVTHDQEEALSMSDRICIMRAGRIVQAGSPADLYDTPADAWVADFVGKSNFLRGRHFGGSVEVAGLHFAGRCPHRALPDGADAVLAVRPELIRLRAGHGHGLDGTIANRIFLGEHSEYLVVAGMFGDLLVLVPKSVEAEQGGYARGDAVSLHWDEQAALILAPG
ncbi:ABC transporter ATP-binding protein [Geminicoccus roseus]|uniref:ABC transporter ATP-binding protein n=1 Tax=Geminicoccus roseus TaxID=404900 RepID=UPI000409FCF4|nr:ABC transporter ATP-binding protein [Geminicoccus roseus]